MSSQPVVVVVVMVCVITTSGGDGDGMYQHNQWWGVRFSTTPGTYHQTLITCRWSECGGVKIISCVLLNIIELQLVK